MRCFGVLLAAAALGAAVVTGGPGLAFGRGGGGGGHFGGFGPRFAGRSVAMGHFDRRFFDRRDRFRRFGRFDRDHRFFFRRGLFGDWGGGWGYPYGDNGYSGYNYPGANNSEFDRFRARAFLDRGERGNRTNVEFLHHLREGLPTP